MSRRALACTAAIIAVLGASTACQPDKTTSSSGSTSTAQKTVPNFVGMGLQSAQDAAQSAGFYTLKSHDALGHSRHQIFDRNWKVCDQNIKAGTAASKNAQLDFGAVKLAETCPANGQAAATKAPTPTSTPTPTPTPAKHTTKPKPATQAPAPAAHAPAPATHTSAAPVDDHGGATARCNDGSLSYSAHHQGTCSHHHGVAVWYK